MNAHLETINASAYQYQEAVQEQFISICQPLFKLGIKYFYYFKIFNDGYYLQFVNNLEYSKKYLSLIRDNGIFFTEQLCAVQRNKDRSFLITDIKQFNKVIDPIPHLLYDFNIWNGFHIYRNKLDFVEVYIFYGTKNDVTLPQFCLQNVNLLNHFIFYFDEKAQNLTDGRDTRKLALFQQTFDFYNTSEEELLNQRISQFLQETQLKRILIKGKYRNIYLCKREAECLAHLSSGKTVKEIGRILGLSPRTIESYFNNAKEKSEYDSKTELLTHFIREMPAAYFDLYSNSRNVKNHHREHL